MNYYDFIFEFYYTINPYTLKIIVKKFSFINAVAEYSEENQLFNIRMHAL